MARPRKILLDLSPLVEALTRALNATAVKASPAKPNGARQAKRKPILCIVPGCKNIAAPRFGMVCAAKHKDLPKRRKEELRAKARERRAKG